MNKYNLDFLSEDIQNGLLKNKRVGMKRRIVRICGGKVEDCISYYPLIKNFVVLKFGGFE